MMRQHLPNWAIRLDSMCISHCRRRAVQSLGKRQEGVNAHKEGAHGKLAEGTLAVRGALRCILFLAGEESDVHDTPWEHPIPCPLSHKLILQYSRA